MATASFSDTQKIKVVSEANPYRKGTKAANTFALLQKSATVGEFKTAAAKRGDAIDPGYLRYSARDGFIKVLGKRPLTN